MTTNNYQIDRRDENGTLDGYEIIKATSIEDALKSYLGDDYASYDMTTGKINSKTVITARCTNETAGYIEITRI